MTDEFVLPCAEWWTGLVVGGAYIWCGSGAEAGSTSALCRLQTREAISHAQAAGCPIVVAITKCDAANAQPARVRQQLLVAGLELEEVGGNIQVGVWGRVAVWGVLWDCFGKKRDDGMPVGRGSTCQSVSCSTHHQPASQPAACQTHRRPAHISLRCRLWRWRR